MKHFGQILKRHIETNGLQKGQVATAAGITYNYLSAIFKKQSVDAELMERLCIAAGLSPYLIFENVPAPLKMNSDNQALGLLGNASINLGNANEKLYLDLLAEKERYIKLLERQLGIKTGTKTEQDQ